MNQHENFDDQIKKIEARILNPGHEVLKPEDAKYSVLEQIQTRLMIIKGDYENDPTFRPMTADQWHAFIQAVKDWINELNLQPNEPKRITDSLEIIQKNIQRITELLPK